MSENQFDVVCVGSALLDLYLKSPKFKQIPSGEFAGGVALCEEFGGKMEVEEAEVTTGGGGSNNAVSFARKGLKTALIAELGTDLVAAAIKQELVIEGVDSSLLVQEPTEETGFSAVLVNQAGGRSVVVYRGAAKMLSKTDIPWDNLYPTWLHISALGGDVELLEGLLGHAKHHGIKVAVNPGKPELEKIDAWGGTELFRDVDVLLVNREEASLMLKRNLSSEEAWNTLSIVGPKLTIVTDGRDGGKYWIDGAGMPYPAATGEVVEETGAGDAFGSGVVAALIRGKDIDTALRWGRIQAENVVRFMGAKRGLFTLSQIEAI